ncbi:MAG: hypothetical protein A3H97_23505 [Acidobacteria bacterium RIFCSPLOWO2_02_FULL_65_29]|nr:MAG: hypothetical protein A3H97_23505 [Acidobacteria bacterium RIFCSPLOWO2_02_FULL_65_29]
MVGNIAQESLIGFSREGRPQPRLAEGWSVAPDGLSVQVRLRAGVTFHDGRPVTAEATRDAIAARFKSYLGPAFNDVSTIRAISPVDVELSLKRRSTFVLEALDVGVQSPDTSAGTGPFKIDRVSDEGANLVANDAYYGGRPSIDRIQVKPYASVRAAWADMLRGQADMLYEVGPDAIEILQPSKAVRVISHLRNYAIIGMLNVERLALRDRGFRQALNTAIDRQVLVSEILRGHGMPADGTVWPSNWAYDSQAPVFRHEPRALGTTRTRLTCVVGDVALERLVLALQQQLHRIGVDLQCELMPVDAVLARVARGDFDVFLADTQLGPTLLQSYRTWRTGAPRNLGGYSNPRVDAALDSIGVAANDDEYRSGVAAFQRAIYDDPPAIFIAWSERARAVSTRFDVPVEPGRDILATLRLWKPVAQPALATRN